jgi:hypothetical protein
MLPAVIGTVPSKSRFVTTNLLPIIAVEEVSSKSTDIAKSIPQIVDLPTPQSQKADESSVEG